jgi:hypothetical protein
MSIVLQNIQKCHSERPLGAKNLRPLTYCKNNNFMAIDSSSLSLS